MNKTYILPIDIKNGANFRTPHFTQQEDGVLIFKVYDDGENFDLSNVIKAEVSHRTPSCEVYVGEADVSTYEGERVIYYEIDKIALVEKGISHLTLYVTDGDRMVASQPFPICVYENAKDASASYLELIQNLIEVMDTLNIDLQEMIKISEKGVPNGVATLDENGKIPLPQMPSEFESYIEHINQTVFKDMVHGLRINDDGVMQYNTPNGWINLNFPPHAGGGGGQILSASVSVNNGTATVVYTGNPTVSSQKWDVGDRDLAYFTLNGKSFNGNQFNVSNTGLHTLWYKDSNGNTYTLLFNVSLDDLPAPNITVSVENGIVTTTIDKDTSVKKWAKGEYDTVYFQYNGTVFSGNSFNVTEVGKYTVYFKLSSGLEYVYVFNVTADMLSKPTISTSVSRGVVTVTHSPNIPISESRWRQGTSTISQGRTGVLYTNGTFNVDSVGIYSVYHKYTNGVEAVKDFSVTQDMLMPSDTTPPTIDFIYSLRGRTYDPSGEIKVGVVQLGFYASDSESGVSRIITPNGVTHTRNPVNGYLITSNGDYTTKAYDNDGNEGVLNFTVNNIGTPTKINTLSEGSMFWFNGEKFILVSKTSAYSLITKYDVSNSQQIKKYVQSLDFRNISLDSTIIESDANSGVLNHEASWNIGRGIPTDEYDFSKPINLLNNKVVSAVGLLNINQLKTIYNNDWVVPTTGGEWSSTPYNENHMFIMNSNGQPSVAKYDYANIRVREAYMVDMEAVTYGVIS